MNTLKASTPADASRPAACLGLDVAKATFVAAWADPRYAGPGTPPTSLPAASFARTPEGLAQLQAWLAPRRDGRDGAVPVVMEATGAYSAELAVWLREADSAFEPAIVNPQDAMHHRKSLGLRNNTDTLAAQALALFGVERRPKPYEPLAPQRQVLRDLTRWRDHLVAQRTALANRMKEPLSTLWVRQREAAERNRLDTAVKCAEQRMKKHLKAHPDLARDVELLQTMTGVGFLTAAVILAEAGDLKRFAKARQLSAFAGLSPAHDESGSSVRGRERLCKKGNQRIRIALYLAAITAIRYDNDFARFYHRLNDAGKPPMVAIAAVMRKMLLVMRAMLITNAPYQPKRQERYGAVDN
jgi:transposase